MGEAEQETEVPPTNRQTMKILVVRLNSPELKTGLYAAYKHEIEEGTEACMVPVWPEFEDGEMVRKPDLMDRNEKAGLPRWLFRVVRRWGEKDADLIASSIRRFYNVDEVLVAELDGYRAFFR